MFWETCATFAANIEQLSFPSLRSVCAHTAYVPELAELWQKANRTLGFLALDCDRLDARHIEALSPLGRLQQLSFRNCVVSSDFLDALAEERSGAWILPHLRQIELTGDSKLEPDNPDSLARLIRARHAAHRGGLSGSPRKINSVAFKQSTIPAWIAEQVAFVLEELQ